MEEKEVLEKIESLKNTIIEFKAKYQKLQDSFDEVSIKNADLVNQINVLQDQLSAVQAQSQQTKHDDQAAKDAFMQELTRAINDANEVLNN